MHAWQGPNLTLRAAKCRQASRSTILKAQPLEHSRRARVPPLAEAEDGIDAQMPSRIVNEAPGRLRRITLPRLRRHNGEAYVGRAVRVGSVAPHQRDAADGLAGGDDGGSRRSPSVTCRRGRCGLQAYEVRPVAVSRVFGREAAGESLACRLGRRDGRGLAAVRGDELGTIVQSHQEFAVAAVARGEVAEDEAGRRDVEARVGHGVVATAVPLQQ